MTDYLLKFPDRTTAVMFGLQNGFATIDDEGNEQIALASHDYALHIIGEHQDSDWWVLPNFSHLLIWWVVMIGYYVVFNTLSGRYHKGLIDVDMIVEGWYVILASGAIGALYAKKLRILWFLISIVLAMLILLLMLLCLGALKALMYP